MQRGAGSHEDVNDAKRSGDADAIGSIIGGVPARELAARYGTPLYAYDLSVVRAEAAALEAGFEGAPHLVCYAVKANSAGPIVRELARAGCGADVVSGAELEVALGAGIPANRIVYSGVAKLDAEIARALTAEAGGPRRGILALYAESVEELDRIAAIARSLGPSACPRARVGLRVNPEIAEVSTHAHVATGHDEAKFGVALADLGAALDRIAGAPELELVGLAVHVGSQLTVTGDYGAGAARLFSLAKDLPEWARASLRFLDTGGGFGIDYGTSGDVAPASDFVRVARAEQRAAGLDHLPLFVEPGRRLVAKSGVLLARVIGVKASGAGRSKREREPWVFVDAGMNDLIRPALYQARHRIVCIERRGGVDGDGEIRRCRVAGPVCESSDDFGIHDLPGDASLVAILDAGAYGYTMASQYNGRALPAEVFIDDGKVVAELPRGDVAAWVRSRLG